MQSLSELKVGDKAKIHAFACAGALKERLQTMGVAKGEAFTVLSKSATGATVEIMLQHGRVALRRGEAGAIEVSATQAAA
ncbi:iron transporter FeoA [Campylobacterota bacterium]|nr:iron transporter FeoA [Campylobacterota bacterium]